MTYYEEPVPALFSFAHKEFIILVEYRVTKIRRVDDTIYFKGANEHDNK